MCEEDKRALSPEWAWPYGHVFQIERCSSIETRSLKRWKGDGVDSETEVADSHYGYSSKSRKRGYTI